MRVAVVVASGTILAIVAAPIAGRDSPVPGVHSPPVAGEGGQVLAMLAEPGPESLLRATTGSDPSPTRAKSRKPAHPGGLVDAVGQHPAGAGLARNAPRKESGDTPGGAGPRQDGDSARDRGLESAQGEVYTWHDGDRKRQVRLQTDLAMRSDGVIHSRADIVTKSELGADRAGAGVGQPVFRSETGRLLMALPGGVVLALDPAWDSSQVEGFFASNQIAMSDVSDLDWLTNGYSVETEPGFASLELANRLATQDGVELSSPNWWTDATTK